MAYFELEAILDRGWWRMRYSAVNARARKMRRGSKTGQTSGEEQRDGLGDSDTSLHLYLRQSPP